MMFSTILSNRVFKNKQNGRTNLLSPILPLLLVLTTFQEASASRVNPFELTQKSAENNIRRVIEPLLEKYCHDECKLMNVNVSVDVYVPDEIAPGFDDVEIKKTNDLAPTSAKIKILLDDKIGPISRRKLLDLVQQYLDTFDYPIKIDTQITHFPQPQGTEGKIAQLRESITKQFKTTTEDLLKQFCPRTCLLADYELKTEVVNGEEAQFGSTGEFVQDGETAIRIKDISATLLMDESLSPDEQSNILEMVKLKTNSFKHVSLTGKSLKFPHPGSEDSSDGIYSSNGNGKRGGLHGSNSDSKSKSESKLNSDSRSSSESKNSSNLKQNSESKNSTNSTNTNSDNNTHQEKFERFEKIERVENGDAVQAELQKFKVFGIIFSASVIALLLFIAAAGLRKDTGGGGQTLIQRAIDQMTSDPTAATGGSERSSSEGGRASNASLTTRYEVERLTEELISVYAQHPKVAKFVFSRILTEEGIETTSQYIHIFGENIVLDMVRDPSLQSDITELMEYYSKNPMELADDEKMDLLKRLYNRTVAGKLSIHGSRSSNLFDFLSEMDGLQILELIRSESLTVKSIVLTQCDPQKRSTIYNQLEPEVRMKLLTELSRTDYLPRDYIFNVANALKRKRKENPKLNTEALPGSDVLVSLLERTGQNMQKTVVKNLEMSSPDSARTIKSKLVSLETLRYLRDGQLLEVVLSLKHEELLSFLKGTTDEICQTIFQKAPRELVVELEEELAHVSAISREAYLAIERKILNKIKTMVIEGQINLLETNERMFGESSFDAAYLESEPGADEGEMRRAS